MRISTALVSSLLVLPLAVGCNDLPTVDSPVAPDVQPVLAASDGMGGLLFDSPVELAGRTTFAAEYLRTGFLFSDPAWNFCTATGVLTSTGGQNRVELVLTEDAPCNRVRTIPGILTPGGVVKLTWPAEDVPVMEEHTGCQANGTYPVYHGTFDGEHLYAETHVLGICDGGTLWGPMLGVSRDMGPVKATFAIDLTIVP